MKSSSLQHLFGKVPFFAPLHSPANHDTAVALHLPEWKLLRFAYRPHLYALPSKERKLRLTITEAALVTNEFCIPLEEEEYD